MKDIRNFIEDNNISFAEGSRNTSIVTLIGFAQFKNISQTDLEEELHQEINKDYFIQQEIDRLWNYCKKNNYKKFWSSQKAKTQYNF